LNAPIAQRRRLTRSADFDVVYRRGRSRSSRHLVVYVFAGAGASPDEARLGITVPRKVGNAVVRNRLKRQLREAMAALGRDAARGSDVVVVARAGLDEAVEAQGFAWLVEELRALVEARSDES
jgi:ribonuclease P protein component